MDQDVAVGIVADEKAEAAGGVEPFDGAGVAGERFAMIKGIGVPLGRRSSLTHLLTRHRCKPFRHTGR